MESYIIQSLYSFNEHNDFEILPCCSNNLFLFSVFFIKKFFFFLSVLGLCGCGWVFSSFSKPELFSICSAWASHCCGFCCCRAQALGLAGFSGCNSPFLFYCQIIFHGITKTLFIHSPVWLFLPFPPKLTAI